VSALRLKFRAGNHLPRTGPAEASHQARFSPSCLDCWWEGLFSPGIGKRYATTGTQARVTVALDCGTMLSMSEVTAFGVCDCCEPREESNAINAKILRPCFRA